jgi:hypothetical protein
VIEQDLMVQINADGETNLEFRGLSIKS